MSGRARIVAAGAVDHDGIAGSSGFVSTWGALGIDVSAVACSWPAAFETPCPSFRRMDVLSRSVILAAEVAGVARILDPAQRSDTAIVLATEHGCLEADLRFARGLPGNADLEPAVFSYTLPSTCLGELAIRHGLGGPCFAVGVEASSYSRGLIEARALIECGEASSAIVCLGDAVTEASAAAAAITPRFELCVFVITCRERGEPAWATWAEVEEPGFLSRAIARLRQRHGEIRA